jgi:hypothetical protein
MKTHEITTRETTLDLVKEFDHIVSKAQAGQNTIVMMGCLLFLAYAAGDAYALDLDDKYACELCVGGEKKRYPVFETDTKWAVKWPWRFFVKGRYIYFEEIDAEGSSDLPYMQAGYIKQYIADYNRNAGTNYSL